MNTKATVAILGIAAAAFALPAAAQMSMPSLSSAYVGGSLGQSKMKLDCTGLSNCDDKDTAWRIFGGFQINRNFSAELGYSDLGKAKFTAPGVDGKFEASAFDLSAIGAWPIANEFSVFGRLGVYEGKVKVGGTGVISSDKNKAGLTFGLGGQYDFNRNLGLRLEWQRYAKMDSGAGGKSDVDSFSIGALWRFQ